MQLASSCLQWGAAAGEQGRRVEQLPQTGCSDNTVAVAPLQAVEIMRAGHKQQQQQ
jgi:hypothetical protein